MTGASNTIAEESVFDPSLAAAAAAVFPSSRGQFISDVELVLGGHSPELEALRLNPLLLQDVFGDAGGYQHPHFASLPGYSVGKVLGRGASGEVRVGLHHLSRHKVAVKVFTKEGMTEDTSTLMRREMRMLGHISGHPRFSSLYETMETVAFVYLVMEYAPRGTLYAHVKGRGRLEEREAAKMMLQITEGLNSCHLHGVVHRDVKLENITLDFKGDVKVIDLGLAAFFVPGTSLFVFCGSPSYAAPEILGHRAYEGPLVDVWSLGIVLFAMLTGYLPFYSSPGTKDIDEKIQQGLFRIPSCIRKSPLARDLVERLLVVDPAKRITLQEVLEHPWFEEHYLRGKPKPPCDSSGRNEGLLGLFGSEDEGSSSEDEEGEEKKPTAPTVDEEAIALIEQSSGCSGDQVLQGLVDGEVNSLTASYHLLVAAKEERLSRRRQIYTKKRYTTYG